MKKKILSCLMVGILSISNCCNVLATEKNIVSADVPVELTEESVARATVETSVEEVMNLEEQEMIGAGHSFGTATRVAVNSVVVDSLLDSNSNYYVFTLPKDGKINIDFSHELFKNTDKCWIIYLYDSNYNQIDSFYSSDGYTETVKSWDYGLTAGTYYLEIDSIYITGTNYSFKVNYEQANNWETEFNNSWLEADGIQLNNEYYGSTPEGSSDYYIFTLSKNGKINIDFSHELFENSDKCWIIYLYDSNHNQIDSFYSSDGYTEAVKSWDYGLPAGTYYLEIASIYITGRNYSFKVNYTQANNWETEFNNSWSAADRIQINSKYYGSIPEGSSDYYLFTLPKNGKINIDFSHELFENSDKCWIIYLYDSNHNQIDSFYASDGYTETVKSWDYGLPAGTYYLEIDSIYITGRNYSFKVNYEQANNWETEFNNSWLAADGIQLNYEYYGSTPEGSSDYYLFTLSKNGKINIDFSHELFENSDKCWIIYLYDSNHNQIDSFYSSEGYTTAVKSGNYDLSAGKYYIKIAAVYGNSNGENYSFKINTKPALNETFQYGNAYYKVKKEGITSEVQFIKMVDPNKTAFTVPSTVSYHGFSYQVTSVRSDAFKNNKKVKSITLEKNVTTLGKNVFYGCKNLKKITVKSTKLKKVGSKSLKGINKKAVIKVPKSKLSKYKKLFKGKGQSKTVKVKKI